MNLENITRLNIAFPIIYRDNTLKRGPKTSEFYFECDDGWFNLIWQFSEQLEKIANLISPTIDRPQMVQVKEKFGGLRLYYWHLPGEYTAIRSLGYALENESFKICEVCGAPGSVRKNSWIRTLCDKDEERRKQASIASFKQ